MPIVSRWIKSESVLHNDIDIYNSVKHRISLKPRIEVLTDRMNFHVTRLNGMLRDLKKQDDETFGKIVSSVKRNDPRYSAILASDLMSIRKVYKIIALSILVFETLESKLKNAVDFGELVDILCPSVAIVKNLRSSLVQNVPEYKDEIAIISELLGAILIDAGQLGGYTINFETANDESAQFLDKASTIVEQKIKEGFPDLPDLSQHSMKEGFNKSRY